MRSAIRDTLFILAVAVIIFLAMNFTLQTSVVTGSSMEPNLHHGQRLVLSKVAYMRQSPEMGDIVVFDPPQNQGSVPLIKRVIGLPGDVVWVDGGSVYVNDKKLLEPYISEPPHYNYEVITVPEGHYFVLGDNRNQSADSHQGWTVPEDNLIAKAWLSIWPIGEIGLAPNINAADIVTVDP
jgi:signal peptidase I